MTLCVNTLQGSMDIAGYGPRRILAFDGDEQKYELWEVRFLGHLQLQKLYDVVNPAVYSTEEPDSKKNTNTNNRACPVSG